MVKMCKSLHCHYQCTEQYGYCWDYTMINVYDMNVVYSNSCYYWVPLIVMLQHREAIQLIQHNNSLATPLMVDVADTNTPF